jgi:uncharacterized protein Usg
MTKADIAREWRKKYPEMPSHQLARKIYKKSPEAFKDIDAVRFALRYIEGKAGARAAKHAKNTEFYKDTPRPLNPYKLPVSDESDFEPYVITGTQYQRVGLMFDVHCPYHSVQAVTVALSYLKKQRIDLLILGGDFWDFYGLSRFLKDPRKRKFGDEIAVGIELLRAIQKALGCKIIYKLGNHCERLQHYLWQKVAEIDQLADLEEIQDLNLEKMVRRRAPELDIEFVDNKRVIRANELNIVHGHEFGQSVFSPVNIARGLYLRAKASTMCGHHHRSSEHSEPNIEGKMVTTWSVGALCELHPSYLPINNWNWGVAMVSLSDDCIHYHVDNKRIFKDQIL